MANHVLSQAADEDIEPDDEAAEALREAAAEETAEVAEYVDSERLIFATSTPGVFGADPNTCPEAEPFDELTPSQLVSLILDIDMTAGISVPIDLHAAKMLQRAQCETIVLDGSDPEDILAAIRTAEFEGTKIIPDQKNEPPS